MKAIEKVIYEVNLAVFFVSTVSTTQNSQDNVVTYQMEQCCRLVKIR